MFERRTIEIDSHEKTGSLAFWFPEYHNVCRMMPFMRLGRPQEPQETSFYVYNRVEERGFRWISYQEAREQEIVARDEELAALIQSKRRVTSSGDQ